MAAPLLELCLETDCSILQSDTCGTTHSGTLYSNMFDPMSHGPKYARVHPLHVKQQTGGWTAHHSFICSHLDCENPKFVAQSFNCSSIPHITLSPFGRGFFWWPFTLLQVGPCAKRELTLAQYRQHDPDVSLTCLDTTCSVCVAYCLWHDWSFAPK